MKKQTDSSHDGGDTSFWRDDRVRNYDYHESLLAEKKTEVQTNIVRIVSYFCDLHSIKTPKILDVGCGPGSPMSIATWVLEKVPNSVLIGADSSEQMIGASNEVFSTKYRGRFTGIISDFNSENFWVREIDSKYDFILSYGALHYLSDRRRTPFLREIRSHLRGNGVFICCLVNSATAPEIVEMENLFRAEFTYGQFEQERRPEDFNEFRKRYEETDKRTNINW